MQWHYFVQHHAHTLFIVFPASRPEWPDLIEIAMKNGKGNYVLLLSVHTDYHVNEFAHQLLRNHAEVTKIHRGSRDKDEFVCAIWKTWISTAGGPAVPCIYRREFC